MTTTATRPEILIASAAPMGNGYGPQTNGHGPKATQITVGLGEIAVLPEVQIRQDGLSQDLVRQYLDYYATPTLERTLDDGPQANPVIKAVADSISNGRDYGRLLLFRVDGLDAETLTRLDLPRQYTYILAGGFSRYFALKVAGKEFARCEIKRGTWADVLLSAGDHNMGNGQPLTADDLKEYGRRLFELTKMSQNQIAQILGVSAPTVSRWKLAWAESHERAAANQSMGRPKEWAKPEDLVDELRAKLARRNSALIVQMGEAKKIAAGDAFLVAELSKTISKPHADDALIQAAALVAAALAAEFEAIRASAPAAAVATLAPVGQIPLTVEEARLVVRLVVDRNSPYGNTAKVTYLENQSNWEIYRRAVADGRTLSDNTLRQAIRDVIADLRKEKAQGEEKNPHRQSGGNGGSHTHASAAAPSTFVAPEEDGSAAGLLRTLRAVAAKLHDGDEDTWIDAMDGDTRLSALRFELKSMIAALGEKIQK